GASTPAGSTLAGSPADSEFGGDDSRETRHHTSVPHPEQLPVALGATQPIAPGAGGSVTGNALDNVLTGNSGNDTLDGGLGADTLVGGAGNDTYYLDNPGDVVTENANEGTDLVNVAFGGYTLGANIENATLTIATGATLTGNALNNILTGNIGNDTLDGGAGADTMVGGTGNDSYTVDNLGDVITENANEGTDSVNVAISGYT